MTKTQVLRWLQSRDPSALAVWWMHEQDDRVDVDYLVSDPSTPSRQTVIAGDDLERLRSAA